MQDSLNALQCQFKDSPFFAQFWGAMPRSAGAGDPPDSANANHLSPWGSGPPNVSDNSASSGTDSPPHGSDSSERNQRGNPDSESGEN